MRGFTLIETLVYIALFGMLMSGAIAAIATIQSTAARNSAQALMLEEGMFLLETLQAAASRGDDLTNFHVSGTTLMQEKVSGDVPVSGNQVQVRDLSFVRNDATGTEPESIDIRFILSTITDTGSTVTRAFSARTYIDSP